MDRLGGAEGQKFIWNLASFSTGQMEHLTSSLNGCWPPHLTKHLLRGMRVWSNQVLAAEALGLDVHGKSDLALPTDDDRSEWMRRKTAVEDALLEMGWAKEQAARRWCEMLAAPLERRAAPCWSEAMAMAPATEALSDSVRPAPGMAARERHFALTCSDKPCDSDPTTSKVGFSSR